MIPDKTADVFNILTFGWLFPLLKTGYSRTLQEEDVWSLDEAKKCQNASDRLERYFYARCPSHLRPSQMVSETRVTNSKDPLEIDKAESSGVHPVDTSPALSQKATTPQARTARSTWTPAFVTDWRSSRMHTKVNLEKLLVEVDEDGIERFYNASLPRALLQATWKPLLVALVLMACNSVINTTNSLVTKRVISHVTARHRWQEMSPNERSGQASEPPSKTGDGIALAFGLALMQLASALTFNHSFARSRDCGIMMKSALMNQIARKSLRLSPKSLIEYTSGKQISAVITDASYVKRSFPAVVTAVIDPLTIIVGFILLILNLGPSALVISVRQTA